MDTRALQVFLSVTETLNFSRSAELLHLSVSAVSRTVQRLEDEVGQPLLERDKRSVRLTSAGLEFRGYAQQAVADWQRLRRRLGSDTELSGQVSVYCSVTASYSILAPILESFRVAHPAVDIMLHTGDQADAIQRAASGQDDLAVSLQPLELPSRLEFLPLLESPLRLCVPSAACAVRDLIYDGAEVRDTIDWSEVPFVVPERGITKTLLEEWFRSLQINPRIYAQVAGHEAIAAMVGLGLGVGISPEIVVATSGMADKVSYIPLQDELPVMTIGLCSLRQRLSSPLVKSLWDVAGQTYG